MSPTKRSLVAVALGAVALAVTYALVTGPLDRNYLVGNLVTAGCIAIAVVGVTLVVGGSHQFHLGQGFFFGLGAYWSAVAQDEWGWPSLVALGSSMVVAGVLSWGIGRVLNRTSGLYFAIATLALAVIGTSLVLKLRTWTGGDNGLAVDVMAVGGWEMEEPAQAYAVVWATALVGAFLASRYLRSRRGRAVRAVGRDEQAARALGISATKARTQAFVISSCYAALGGGLLAFSSGFLYPDSFGLVASVEMVVFVIVGAVTVGGALVATGALALIPLVFEALERQLDLVLGLVLVALLLFLPEDLRVSLPGRRRREAVAPAGPTVATAAPPPTATAPAPGRPAPAPATLALRGLTKHFGGVHAVQDVSFEIPTGQLTSLVGPNGAGKSTTFALIGGQLRPTGGTASWDGRTITGLSPERIAQLGIARTFQTSRPIPGFSVLDNVVVGGHLLASGTLAEDVLGGPRHRREEAELRDRAHEALALVGLDHLAGRGVDELSYGQRRLLEIARALAARPRLLMVDEPAAGLNGAETDVLGDLLGRLVHDHGLGVLLVEHNLGLVMRVSDQVAVLDFGHLIAFGPPDQVAADERVIEAYLGVSGEVADAAG